MRLASILAAVVLAGTLAASASATARPVTPQDRALLWRAYILSLLGGGGK